VDPALQMQSDPSSLASGAWELTGHVWHTSDVAAIAVEKYPTPHETHCPAPAAVWNLPATQAAQSWPFSPENPALQEHAVDSALASGASEFAEHATHTLLAAPTTLEYCPGKQLAHAASPVASLYLPATHSAHAVPSSPVDPALQVQSVSRTLDCGEWELDRQSRHTSSMAPISGKYWPGWQLTHAESPC